VKDVNPFTAAPGGAIVLGALPLLRYHADDQLAEIVSNAVTSSLGCG